MEKPAELLTMTSGEAEQPFEWSTGKYTAKFLSEIRDHKRILGVRCPKCQKVFVPPRKVCGECFVTMEELVELGNQGTIFCFTVLSFGFVDPDTGVQRPVPYTWAFIKPDGADNCIPHFVDITDPKKLRVGMRVEAVFEEKRRGHLLDIRHFKVIQD